MGLLRNRHTALLVAGFLAAFGGGAQAQKAYDTGATDTEIKIGNIVAYSGPASAYGTIGRVEEAYFRMINAQGGVNGRKINFITYDDAYSPPKTVEQVRKLVESDEVLLVFGVLGTPGNTAIQKYLNSKKVPQLFVASGATKFGRGADFPWTMGWQPSYQTEGRVFAKYILQARPSGRIGVLYQNDDFGKDLLQGLKDGLGSRAASMIALEEPYEVSEPTVDARMLKLKQSGADVFVSFTTPKFAAQAIRKAAEMAWKPLYLQSNVSSSLGSVMKPAGIENAQGIFSTAYLKDPTDPAWKNDPGMTQYLAFMRTHFPEGNTADSSNIYGYTAARALIQVLKQAGNNLTRDNVMRQAANLRGCCEDTLLPGITVNTAANDYYPIEQLQMMRLQGDAWQVFGSAMDGALEGRNSPAVAVAAAPQPSPVAAPPPPVAARPAPPPVIAQPQPQPPAAPSTAAAVNTPGRKVALVIGNSTYKFMPSLQNPRNDANDIAGALKGLGFETVVATDLDRTGMNGAIDRYSRLVQGASVAMVYYAGHGMQFMGKNYLLPTDANLESAADVNRYRLLPVDDLVELLGQSSGLQLIVLDACRNNPVERDFKNKVASVAGANRDVASTRGIARIETRSGLVVAYATAPNDVAADGTGRNSPFAQAFLKNVVMPDIDVLKMLSNVQREVYVSSGSKQLPEISSLYVGPEISFRTLRK